MERKTGIEPASLAWKASALPLSYFRTNSARPPLGKAEQDERSRQSLVVGEAGFEPATSASRTLRATQTALLSELTWIF